MYNGKLISCKAVIDRVYGDANLEVNIEEAVRWIGTTLDYIGCPAILKTIVTNGLTDEDGTSHPPIPVLAYRGTLPTDLHSITSCANYETKRMMYEITDTLYKSYGDDEYPNVLQENSYIANNNYVFTGFEEGYLELCYNAYPLDTEGFPKIPDDEKVMEAVKWTIIKNLDYLSLRAGKITRDIYEISNKEYNWAIGGATNRMQIPSIDGMESWMRMHTQLIPRLKLHSVAFRQPEKATYTQAPNMYKKVEIIGDAQSVFTSMSLYGVNGSNSTNNVLYWDFIVSGTTRTINIYSNVAKTAGYLVAHATGLILDGNTLKVTLVADNASGLTGDITFSIPTAGAISDTDEANLIIFYNA